MQEVQVPFFIGICSFRENYNFTKLFPTKDIQKFIFAKFTAHFHTNFHFKEITNI